VHGRELDAVAVVACPAQREATRAEHRGVLGDGLARGFALGLVEHGSVVAIRPLGRARDVLEVLVQTVAAQAPDHRRRVGGAGERREELGGADYPPLLAYRDRKTRDSLRERLPADERRADARRGVLTETARRSSQHHAHVRLARTARITQDGEVRLQRPLRSGCVEQLFRA
jgi:hypothetical protein